jgi:hypothetical protein
VSNKHDKTLEVIFRVPIQANVKWKDIESLFIYLGAEITQGGGSIIGVKLKGNRAVFHRPHPRPETDKEVLKSVRKFLESVGVNNDDL